MTPDVRHSILAAIAHDATNVATRLAELHGVTRQSASAWLTKLKREGFITASGAGRGICYQLVPQAHLRRIYSRVDLQEDRVWREAIAPSLQDLPGNVRDIWQYAVTEIVNNAIDYSGSEQVMVVLLRMR
jgi:DNA-binding IclR family transcriptional regulator